MCGSKIKKAVKSVVNVTTLGLLSDGMRAPDAPDAPKAPDPTPTAVDPGVSAAREDERRRRAAAAGQSSTILTGAQGLLSEAQTGRKTLLGA